MAIKRHQVLIAGAGPVGLGAALFLRERHIDVEVVDPAEGPSSDDLAVILHADTLARLADHGVPIDVGREARPVDTVAVYDHERRHATVDLGPGSPRCAAVLPLWLLCKKLEAALKQHGVKVAWNHRMTRFDVDNDGIHAQVDLLEVDTTGYARMASEKIVERSVVHEPTFLIGADGRESAVRTQARMGWHATGQAEVIAAFEVDCALELGNEIRVVMNDGATVLWPLPDGGVQVAFHLAPDAGLRPGAEADAEDLMNLLRAHAPWVDLGVRRVRRGHVELAEPAAADHDRKGYVWLLGDAAHTLPLTASQSLNQGLRDAALMAADLAYVLNGAAPAHHESLARAYVPSDRADRFVQSSFARILPALPALGAGLDPLARQLGLAPISPT